MYLTNSNERMTESREKDLCCHDEDIFSIKKSLPLLPTFGMSINFRTHSFNMCRSVSFNDIPLLKNKMNQRNNKNTKFFLHKSSETNLSNFRVPYLHPIRPINSFLD